MINVGDTVKLRGNLTPMKMVVKDIVLRAMAETYIVVNWFDREDQLNEFIYPESSLEKIDK